MEINFKINFPDIIGNESQNKTEVKFPKSFNESYLIDFGNFDCKKALKSIEPTQAALTKNIVLNINDEKKVQMIEKKNEQKRRES